MINKHAARMKRTRRIRGRIRRQEKIRLCVNKTPRHMYAQLISADGAKVLAAASTLDKDLRGDLKYSGNCDAAKKVGDLLAKRAKAAGIEEGIAFDCSGHKYHGRIKVLADAARAGGMDF